MIRASMSMRFVTVCNMEHPILEVLKRSAQYHGIDLTVLGLGKPYHGNGTKITLVREFLASMEPEEVLVYTDAWDSLFVAPETRFREKFAEFKRPIVFGAEQNLGVRGNDVLWTWQFMPTYLRYPSSPTPYRFLNAGGFMGEAKSLLDLFDQVPIEANTPSDQTVFTQHYARNPDLLDLDRHQEIFACNGGRAGLEDSDYTVLPDGDILNEITKTHPCIVHIPGVARKGLGDIISALGLEDPSGPAPTYAEISRAMVWRHRIVDFLGIDNFTLRAIEANLLVLLILSIIGGLLFLFS